MIMQQFGVTNPVVSIQEYLNTITDQLKLSNIKNVGRYFKTPDPQTLQAIASTPKEPDAMTIAAKAQYEKVKSETAQALGEQQFKQQKLQTDDAFRHEKLRQDSIYDQQKLAIDAAKAKIELAGQNQPPPAPDPIEAAKVGVGLHQAHLDAAMQERELQAKLAIEAAKIEQQREAAQLQASTAFATAQQRNNGGGGA
jgi:hypothetical protein